MPMASRSTRPGHRNAPVQRRLSAKRLPVSPCQYTNVRKSMVCSAPSMAASYGQERSIAVAQDLDVVALGRRGRRSSFERAPESVERIVGLAAGSVLRSVGPSSAGGGAPGPCRARVLDLRSSCGRAAVGARLFGVARRQPHRSSEIDVSSDHNKSATIPASGP